MFRERIAPILLAATLLTACDTETTAPAGWSGALVPNQASLVTLEWQEIARNEVAAGSLSPLAAARLYAALGIAQARAVAAADAASGNDHEGDTGGYGPGGRARYEASRGAVAAASLRVLDWFFPALEAAHEQTMRDQAQSGPGGVHPQFRRGLTIGRAAGNAVVAHLMNDGFTTPWTGMVPVGPGLWTPTSLPPAGGTFGGVTPWFMEHGAQFRPAPPPVFGTADFDAAVNEVLTITSNLTPQQLAIALGWAYGTGTPTPLGYWNALAASYIAAENLDEAGAARVFAFMSGAIHDALIAAFEAKYYYWTLRPHQADPGISLAFPVPNYPAYPSGHGSVSGSAARVLAHFFPARAAELTALVDEAALSRIYAGIHYRFDMTAARQMSEAIADYAISRGLP